LILAQCQNFKNFPYRPGQESLHALVVEALALFALSRSIGLRQNHIDATHTAVYKVSNKVLALRARSGGHLALLFHHDVEL
jgi:hypothetical protein